MLAENVWGFRKTSLSSLTKHEYVSSREPVADYETMLYFQQDFAFLFYVWREEAVS